ncbi:hypothetical protein N9I63_04065 [Hyphomicrobiales bacterium]|nr:hypothetical protein [Hyphomicrobiales bacterium]
MRLLLKNYFLLFMGFFVLANLSLHPLEHSLTDYLEEETTCEICVNELPNPETVSLRFSDIVLSTNSFFKVKESLSSNHISNNTHTRAPPKI